MKLRVTDKLALALLLFVAVLWVTSYVRSMTVMVDWRSGGTQGPPIANFTAHHDAGNIELLLGPENHIGSSPFVIIWDERAEFEHSVSFFMGEGERRKMMTFPGFVYEESLMASTLTVSYAHPFLLIATVWAGVLLWRRWRATRRLLVMPSLQ